MSTKEKILLAIYREYKRGNSDMRQSVGHQRLQVDPELFNQEIQTLQTEGLIRGAVLVKDRYNKFPDQVILNRVGLTHRGLHYVRSSVLVNNAE